MSKLFFILDCEGQIVGNSKGYATIRGAIREHNKKGSKVYKEIWGRFELKRLIDPKWTYVSKICAYEDLNDSVKGLLGYRLG
jgi:hypothetical protein